MYQFGLILQHAVTVRYFCPVRPVHFALAVVFSFKMRNILFCLLAICSAGCERALAHDTESNQGEREVRNILRLRNILIRSAIADNTPVLSDDAGIEEDSASIALAGTLYDQDGDESAPISLETFTKDEAAPVVAHGTRFISAKGRRSRARTTTLTSSQAFTIRPKKLFYPELPLGTTWDPVIKEIGPDGNLLPFRRWFEHYTRPYPHFDLPETTHATTQPSASVKDLDSNAESVQSN